MIEERIEYAPDDIPGYLNGAPIHYTVYICEHCGEEFDRDNAHSDEYCDDCMKEMWEDDLTKEEMWEYLECDDYCTENELELVIDLMGYTTETMYKILYAVTGYNYFYEITNDWELY